MIKLLRYLSSRQSFLLFVLLEIIALILIIGAHDYALTKTHSLQTVISGNFNRTIYAFRQHFSLKSYNDSLIKQNALLLKILQMSKRDTTFMPPALPEQYHFIPAFVISNQYNLQHNTLLINKGRNDGVLPDSGVISTNGIVGVVQKTSPHFSKVISILNKNLKVNVALKHTNYSGFLQWPGNDPNTFEVIDLPVDAPLKKGDTVVTGGMSGVFPKNIPVGYVVGYNLVTGRKSYKVRIKSFADMTALGPVYIVKNRLKTEMDSLLNPLKKK